MDKKKRDVVEAFDLILRGARKLVRIEQRNRKKSRRKRPADGEHDTPKGTAHE